MKQFVKKWYNYLKLNDTDTSQESSGKMFFYGVVGFIIVFIISIFI